MMESTLRDPLLLCKVVVVGDIFSVPGLLHQSSDSGELTSVTSQRQSPCTLKLAQEYPPGMSGAVSSSSADNEILLIRHTWNAFRHRLEFWLHDQFHVLMSLPFRYLVVVLVIGEALFALFLAFTLWLMTWGDVQGCLGEVDQSIANYYYFAIETMFTIGFGSPRHPSCTAANIWTSIAVLFTNVVHGCVVGIVFSKFSSGATRRYALAFSPSLLGSVSESAMNQKTMPGPSPASASTKDNSQREWHRLHSNSYTLNGLMKTSGGAPQFPPSGAYDQNAFLSPASAAVAGSSSCVSGHCCNSCGSLAVEIRDQADFLDRVNLFPPTALNHPDYANLSFSLSFRLMNLTECAFFDPKLSIFLMRHDSYDLTICQLTTFYTDMPLQFLELPITVTIGDNELKDAFGQNGCSSPLTLSEIIQKGDRFELLVLISFVDNQSSRLLELRKSWKFSQIQWGYTFQRIVQRRGRGIAYQVDVECLDNKVVRPVTQTPFPLGIAGPLECGICISNWKITHSA